MSVRDHPVSRWMGSTKTAATYVWPGLDMNTARVATARMVQP